MQPLPLRFWQYLKERFPLHQHGLLIVAFSFSAISYSIITRGAEGFISAPVFVWAVFSNLSLFFLLRVFDEFKDAKDDAAFRSELPVPRGLISLKELAIIASIWLGLHFIGQLILFPELLWMYFLVIGYMLLMRVEFFVPEWLKIRPMAYALSHMMIIPLVDVFASGFDWQLAGADAPIGMLYFFAVSFFNGMVLEIGRKIRIPADEKEGVVSYSSQYGWKKALGLWTGMLMITYILCWLAGNYAGFDWMWKVLLSVPFVISVFFGFRFWQNQTSKRAKTIEIISGIWALFMYLLLGAGPMIVSWFS